VLQAAKHENNDMIENVWILAVLILTIYVVLFAFRAERVNRTGREIEKERGE
jgi:hypothetical protein